jgi:hypothetical protein
MIDHLHDTPITSVDDPRYCPLCGLNPQPNAETVKTLIESDAGVGLTRFDSTEAFFASLKDKMETDDEPFAETGLHVTIEEVKVWMEAVKLDPTTPRPVPHL